MSDSHWRRHWERHALRNQDSNPLAQVQRTLHGQPITEAQLRAIELDIASKLAIRPGHRLLDLCGANGLVSARAPLGAGHRVVVDFCLPLLRRQVPSRLRTSLVACDAKLPSFANQSFDRVLVAAALQHFDETEIVSLLEELRLLLRTGGILLLTDVPDRRRLWAFFDTIARRQAYFESVRQKKPILGTWVDRRWLAEAATSLGFSEVEDLDQPHSLPYHHYRFDLRARRLT